jgi:hypothetical protein
MVLLMAAEEALAKSRRLLGQIQDELLKEKILEVLPQGHGSGLDADLLDGLHAAEILAKMRVVGGGGGGGGITDHGALTGLDDPADHAWAFLVDGSRAMTGNLQLGAYRLQTTNLSIVEFDSGTLAIYSHSGSAPKSILLNFLYSNAIFGDAIYPKDLVLDILTDRAIEQIWMRSFDGASLQTVLLALEGRVDIPRAGDITMLDDRFLKVAKDSDGSLPTPSASYRGKMIRVEGGEGVADQAFMCMKKTDESYEWVPMATG